MTMSIPQMVCDPVHLLALVAAILTSHKSQSQQIKMHRCETGILGQVNKASSPPAKQDCSKTHHLRGPVAVFDCCLHMLPSCLTVSESA